LQACKALIDIAQFPDILPHCHQVGVAREGGVKAGIQDFKASLFRRGF